MTVHKLCARITLPDGYSFLALVDDEQGAVQAGLDKHATSFTVSEVDVATPEDNVDWVFTHTSEDSERRYMGVDKLYNVDDMLAAWDKHIDELKDSDSPHDQGVREAFQVTAGLYRKYRDAFNNVAFIPEPYAYRKEWEFHALHNGEKAFDSKGVQVWPPAPAP